jgi:hypothetical protein
LQKLNANTKLQKLKRRKNTKTIAETEHKYQIAKVEGKSKYQILQKQKTKYHSIFFLQKLKRRRNTRTIAETKHKYQIAEAEEKSKYQILQKWKTKYHSKIIFFCRN